MVWKIVLIIPSTLWFEKLFWLPRQHYVRILFHQLRPSENEIAQIEKRQVSHHQQSEKNKQYRANTKTQSLE